VTVTVRLAALAVSAADVAVIVAAPPPVAGALHYRSRRCRWRWRAHLGPLRVQVTPLFAESLVTVAVIFTLCPSSIASAEPGLKLTPIALLPQPPT
jgi:hypothetical protein